MIHVCKSYYVSHFAAFFIDARTKRSVVESFMFCLVELNVGLVLKSKSVFVIASIMILPQVHLRKPCYDFYFL